MGRGCKSLRRNHSSCHLLVTPLRCCQQHTALVAREGRRTSGGRLQSARAPTASAYMDRPARRPLVRTQAPPPTYRVGEQPQGTPGATRTLSMWAGRSTGGHGARTAAIRVQIPVGPPHALLSSTMARTFAFQASGVGSTPAGSTRSGSANGRPQRSERCYRGSSPRPDSRPGVAQQPERPPDMREVGGASPPARTRHRRGVTATHTPFKRGDGGSSPFVGTNSNRNRIPSWRKWQRKRLLPARLQDRSLPTGPFAPVAQLAEVAVSDTVGAGSNPARGTIVGRLGMSEPNAL